MFKLALSTLLGVAAGVSSVAFSTEIPVNIGAGPAAFYVPEHLDEEDPKPFYGLRLHIKAIVNRELIQKNKGKVPDQYRKAVEKVDEARVGYLLIPESIMLGTRKEPHGPEFYGATWSPLSVGLPVRMGPARLSLDAGLVLTYAYVNLGDYKLVDQTDDELKSLHRGDEVRYRRQVTHFFRPGGELGLDLEIAFSESVLTSFG